MDIWPKKVSKIEKKLEELRKSCFYNEALTKQITRALDSDSLYHSDALEPNSSCLDDTLDPDSTFDGQRQQNIFDAWEYATKNFEGTLNDDFIEEVANYIEPSIRGYRRLTARITHNDGTINIRTNPVKVSREMYKLLDHINNSPEEKSPIISASELSLYGLFIHPFDDGNGRTFRLLHNLILQHHNIPPVIIKRAERRAYNMLVGIAKDGFDKRQGEQDMFTYPSIQELEYHGFMLDKVQESVENISERYANFRRYSIECNFKGDAKKINGVRDMLRRGCRANGFALTSSTDRGELSISVVTDAPKGILESSLHNYQNRHKWFKKYNLEKS